MNCRKGLKRLKSTVPGPERAVFYNEDGRIRNKLCLKIQTLHIAPPYNLYIPDSSRFRSAAWTAPSYLKWKATVRQHPALYKSRKIVSG